LGRLVQHHQLERVKLTAARRPPQTAAKRIKHKRPYQGLRESTSIFLGPSEKIEGPTGSLLK
jgi:hypothetical protein